MDVTETQKSQLAASKVAAEKTLQDQERVAKGKPTPTQEENDLARVGVHVTEHEDDGSGPDPNNPVGLDQRQIEAKRPGQNYQTRAAQPASRPAATTHRSE